MFIADAACLLFQLGHAASKIPTHGGSPGVAAKSTGPAAIAHGVARRLLFELVVELQVRVAVGTACHNQPGLCPSCLHAHTALAATPCCGRWPLHRCCQAH